MFDIGTTAGQVAAGEKVLYIANNLSDIGTAATARTNLGLGNAATVSLTRGTTAIGNSSGVAAAYALPSAGLFLGSDGTDMLGRQPPGYLLLNDAGTTATNPTAATTILAGGASSNLWPAYVAAGDMVEVTAVGTLTMASSSTVTWTILQGATTVATLGPNLASTSQRGWQFSVKFVYLSSTSVIPVGWAALRSTTSAGFTQGAASGDSFAGDGTPVTVTAPPQNFDLKALIATGNAASTVICKSCQVRYYPVGR